MKRFLLSLLAIFFPWIVILIDGKAIGAFANLALQLTFIGWLPASIWAFKTVSKLCNHKKPSDGNETNTKTQAPEEPIENTIISKDAKINTQTSENNTENKPINDETPTAPKEK